MPFRQKLTNLKQTLEICLLLFCMLVLFALLLPFTKEERCPCGRKH